jgi:hypothetical protein
MCHCEQSEGRFDPRPPHQVRGPRNDYFLKSFTIVCFYIRKTRFRQEGNEWKWVDKSGGERQDFFLTFNSKLLTSFDHPLLPPEPFKLFSVGVR